MATLDLVEGIIIVLRRPRAIKRLAKKVHILERGCSLVENPPIIKSFGVSRIIGRKEWSES